MEFLLNIGIDHDIGLIKNLEQSCDLLKTFLRY